MSENATLVNDYLEHMRRDLNRRPLTIHRYRLTYVLLLQHLGRKRLVECDHEDLRGWLRRDRPQTTGDPSPATLKREIMELRSLYKWLHQHQGLVASNPTVKLHPPKVHNEDPHPAPEDAWRAVWAADLSDTERVAYGLAFFCGLRRQEVTQLRPTNFVDRPKPRLVDLERKGGAKSSVAYKSCVDFFVQRRPDLIGGDAATFLKPLARLRARPADAPLLDWQRRRKAHNDRYGKPDTVIDPHQFNRTLRQRLESLGLADNLFTPHALRHSFCTNMLAMGVPLLTVSRLAGHSSVAITQRYIWTSEDPLGDLLDADDLVTAASPW
jgi:site-specific recombinase XerD